MRVSTASGSLRVTTTLGFWAVTTVRGVGVPPEGRAPLAWGAAIHNLPARALGARLDGLSTSPHNAGGMGNLRKTAARLGAAMVVAGLLGGLAVAVAGPAAAQELRAPRWVSLRSNEVNVRVGPGKEYLIVWVFVRERLPLEITAEFDNWRRIRDMDGEEGWVHRALLANARTVVVTGGTRTLRRTPDAYARPVLRAEAGVIGDLLECVGVWCRLEIAGKNGWLPRVQMWGVYPDEAVE